MRYTKGNTTHRVCSIMQFQVPQFLDVEDKIVGPFTIKQFIYLAGGVGMGYMAYRFIPLIGFIIGLGMIALGWALGFYKYNGKPFVYIIEAAFLYAKKDRLYVWKRKERAAEAALDLSNFKPTKHTSSLSNEHNANRLNSLAWSVNMEKGKTEEEDLLT